MIALPSLEQLALCLIGGIIVAVLVEVWCIWWRRNEWRFPIDEDDDVIQLTNWRRR